MKRYLFPLACLLALGAVLTLASRSVAQQTCVPFQATSTVRLSLLSVNGNMAALAVNGTGVGTPIGPYAQSGTILFVFQPNNILFTSSTAIATPAGAIFTREVGVSLPAGATGTYRLTGGTGAYVGAHGSGSFSVVRNPDGTQTATYNGTLCLPPAG
jgi:hypothetical protein